MAEQASQATIHEQIQARAEALPGAEVRDPHMPVAIFLEEGRGYLGAARRHAQALAAAGMPQELPAQLDAALGVLQELQDSWEQRRRPRRSEALIALIDAAQDLRADTLAAATLALRHDREGRRRLRAIRRGSGQADWSADFLDLSLLLRDFAKLFAPLHIDTAARADELYATGIKLVDALAGEHAKRSTINKEPRDRAFELCRRLVDELRAFAAFAFRDDRGGSRRQAFVSAYWRRINRRHRSGKSPAGQGSEARS